MQIPTTRTTACPICGSRMLAPWRRRSRDRSHGLLDQEFDYARCRDCGARFLADWPEPSELAKLYPAEYRPYVQESSPAGMPAGPPPRALQREIDAFYAPDADGGCLLDFGCGGPAFVDAARASGWRTIGADFTPEVVEHVRAKGHHAVLVGEPLDAEVLDGTVARIRMNHVLEHLPDARATLAQLRRKLAPGGRIHIATPNPASVGSAVFRTRWFSLDAPRHLVMYPPALAVRLLREAGFAGPRVFHEVVGKDLLRSWGYLMQDVGRMDRDRAWPLASNRRGLTLAAVPERVAALFSASDRFHVFAGT